MKFTNNSAPKDHTIFDKKITELYEMFLNKGVADKKEEIRQFKELPGSKDFIIEKFNTHPVGNEAIVVFELYEQLISGELSNFTFDM